MDVVRIQESKKGNSFVPKVLRNKQTVISKANLVFSPGGISLKIGRYNKATKQPDEETPKSELSLDNEELSNLVSLLQDNYNLVLSGKGEYIKAGDDLDAAFVRKLRDIFAGKDKEDVIDFFVKNKFLPDDLEIVLETKRRQAAILEFEAKLNDNEVEYAWQKWFTDNSWVLGGDFAEIIDERHINTQNIADYLVKDFDGFVDLIEIKRPEGGLSFWNPEKDHNNLVPHGDLIKAVTQAQVYLIELEKEIDSIATRDRLSGASIIKPRATLIFGRSNLWGEEEKTAYRILNSGYSNITILTYDHVLRRSRRMTNLQEMLKKDKDTSSDKDNQ